MSQHNIASQASRDSVNSHHPTQQSSTCAATCASVAQARLLCRALCPALCRYLPHLSQFVYRRRLSSIPWRYSIHFVCILFPGPALQKLPCPPSQFFPQTGRPLRNDERLQEFCLFGPDCFRGSGCKKNTCYVFSYVLQVCARRDRRNGRGASITDACSWCWFAHWHGQAASLSKMPSHARSVTS